MKCIESDVMWYNRSIVEKTELWNIRVNMLHSTVQAPPPVVKVHPPPPPHHSILSHSIVYVTLYLLQCPQ